MMEQFVKFAGTWEPCKVDFKGMKNFCISMGMPAEALEGKEEQWTKVTIEVSEDGITWKYSNVPGPGGDMAVTFDLEQGTYTRKGTSWEQKGSFKTEGGAVITEQSFGGEKKLKTTTKLTGDAMAVMQTYGDASVETLFNKCA